jgi:hypothetical protein
MEWKDTPLPVVYNVQINFVCPNCGKFQQGEFSDLCTTDAICEEDAFPEIWADVVCRSCQRSFRIS